MCVTYVEVTFKTFTVITEKVKYQKKGSISSNVNGTPWP